MKLDPVAPRKPAPSGSAVTIDDAGAPPPNLVPIDLSKDRIQLLGMRTAKVARGALVAQIRTTGVVAAPEDGVSKVHARFAGWIQQVRVNQTGQRVAKGEVLATVYSPDILVAEQELFAARHWGAMPIPGVALDAGAGLDVDSRNRIELLGISAEDIAAIEKTGKPQAVVNLRSPASGTVFQKTAVNGLYFQPGTELFTIADLARVWVLVDVYENEISRVRVGQPAKVVLQSLGGTSFDAVVKLIYPTVNPATRTMRVRVELPNPKGQLRPGMFADVLLDLPPSDGLTVPSEALVDTGEHQYVFVSHEGGHFEPRAVRVGARAGGNVEILAGLAADETVVTTGNFLLDSESRLRAVVEHGAPAP